MLPTMREEALLGIRMSAPASESDVAGEVRRAREVEDYQAGPCLSSHGFGEYVLVSFPTMPD